MPWCLERNSLSLVMKQARDCNNMSSPHISPLSGSARRVKMCCPPDAAWLSGDGLLDGLDGLLVVHVVCRSRSKRC